MSEARGELPQMPQNVPHFAPTFGGRLCARLLQFAGWRVAGELPNVAKVVVIAAPHSSNWDGVWGLLAKVALRLDMHFLGKREAFFWPLGVLLRRVGGMPIDRQGKHDIVSEMVAQFAQRERFWFGVAPEGTRKRVQTWKSGFWHVAKKAGVPILPIYFDYPSRTVGLLPVFQPGDDLEADMQRLRAMYAPYRGKNRNTA